jgi:Protein of unknown function (DUF2789)
MNTAPPEFSDLFAQLGLPSDEASIQAFIQTHHLPEGVLLDQGNCWTPAQARLLRESLAQDGDWAPMVDRLNVAMHKPRD